MTGSLRRGRPAVRPSSKLAAPARPDYHCTDCGFTAAKWVGRCPECQAWGTLEEVGAQRAALRRVSAGPVSRPAQRMVDVDAGAVTARPSGLAELDRVLGGGLVPGSVVLLAGEPGVGKSTLLLAAAQAWVLAGNGAALIVTGEESAGQVRLRADRLGALHADLFLAAETELSAVLSHIDQVAPTLLIVDSIQTIAAADVDGAGGGVTQVRAVAAALTAVAKDRGIACVLVGHVTKDGSIAGPRMLEHLVDVVLHFEGDRNSSLRLVRGVKNRFGPSDEVGCFQMVDNGIVGLSDPSGLFLSGRRSAIPGTCATIGVQGRRALPVEIQALVGPAGADGARRTVSGLDTSRVAMVLAVCGRWAGVQVGNRDVLAATVGGARMVEPAADLALAMAVWSSVRDIPLHTGLVAIGEIGLSADVRPVPGLGRRLTEARRLGFDHAVVPAGGVARSAAGRATGNDAGGAAAAGDNWQVPDGMRVSEVSDLGEAMRCLGNDAGVVRWLQRAPR